MVLVHLINVIVIVTPISSIPIQRDHVRHDYSCASPAVPHTPSRKARALGERFDASTQHTKAHVLGSDVRARTHTTHTHADMRSPRQPLADRSRGIRFALSGLQLRRSERIQNNTQRSTDRQSEGQRFICILAVDNVTLVSSVSSIQFFIVAGFGETCARSFPNQFTSS